METLTFDINKTNISLTNSTCCTPYLVAKNTDYQCVFTWSEEWNSLTKKATFHNTHSGIKKARLLENGSCLIPYEVLTYGNLEIGLGGYDGDDLIKNSRLYQKAVQRSAGDNDEDMEPIEPTLFEEIMAKIAACDKGVVSGGIDSLDNHLYVTLTNGDRIDFGVMQAGDNDGAPLVDAYLDNDNRLVLVYEDETEVVSSAPILPSLDSTLVLEHNMLRVNTTNNVNEDNTLPITSAGVYTQLGNIEALLQTI